MRNFTDCCGVVGPKREEVGVVEEEGVASEKLIFFAKGVWPGGARAEARWGVARMDCAGVVVVEVVGTEYWNCEAVVCCFLAGVGRSFVVNRVRPGTKRTNKFVIKIKMVMYKITFKMFSMLI